MKILNKVKAYLNSLTVSALFDKHVLAIVVFVIWVSFFDRYSVVNQFKLSNNIEQLEQAKLDYEFQLKEALKEREIINSDIEKYAREKFLFHKDNEKVIVIK